MSRPSPNYRWAESYRKAKRVEVAYYQSNPSHPGYLPYHRLQVENLDFTKEFIDTCLAEVPGEGLADALRTELEHQLRVVDHVCKLAESGEYRHKPLELPKNPCAELEYAALLLDDIRTDKNIDTAEVGGLSERAKDHLQALQEGLRYLEQQRKRRLADK
ncbi:hypothetical protein Q8F55_008245 [Vanrija albida]|uniref:Uncharacterized protein n=1 Tax=Vanrija albida TaxID=181172 RepID=A0ABR3PVT2_9TREE